MLLDTIQMYPKNLKILELKPDFYPLGSVPMKYNKINDELATLPGFSNTPSTPTKSCVTRFLTSLHLNSVHYLI